MTPELRVILLVLVVVGAAYLVVYPRVVRDSFRRLILLDIVWTVSILVVVGMAYAGTATRFSLLLFSTNWWIFTLVAAAIIEMPIALWYCRKWGIDPGGPPPD